MAMDYTTPIGRVRLLIADVSEDTSKQLLTDSMVTGYLANEGAPTTDPSSWHIRRAAAAALDAIATSEALVSKVIRTQDLSTDGAKLAAELRAQAAAMRARADVDEEAADDGSYMGVVEFSPYPDGSTGEAAERPFGWWV